MVLWEITAMTAYFLGLKRTYKIALRMQRGLVGPNHPRIRQFLYRRTRSIFDMAVSVHKNIQERDLEVGRSLGNWILRWLDRMKPSAQIRPYPPPRSNILPKHPTSRDTSFGTHRSSVKSIDRQSKGRQLFTSLNIRPKYFPTISMMMQPRRPVGIGSPYRHLSYNLPFTPAPTYRRNPFEGVFRKDIAQWMMHT